MVAARWGMGRLYAGGARLAEVGDVGVGAGAVVGVGGGKAGGEEALFGVDADLGASDEEEDSREEHRPPGKAEASA